MTENTPIRDGSVSQALIAMCFGALGLTATLLLAGNSVSLSSAVIAGVACAAIPIARASRTNPPRMLGDVFELCRISTLTFSLWLGVMAIYSWKGMPMGSMLFDLLVGTCVTGLVASRIVFPALIVALAQRYRRHSAQE